MNLNKNSTLPKIARSVGKKKKKELKNKGKYLPLSFHLAYGLKLVTPWSW